MKTAILLLFLIFVGLFVLTTFPQSAALRDQAADAGFQEEEIDTGWRLAVQRKLLMWAGTFLSLGFLTTLACSSRARRLADRFERWSGGRWWLTVLLMGAFCFLVEEILLFPIAVVGLEIWRAWEMTDRSFGDWLLDYGKSLALSAGLGVVILLGFYALLRWCPRTWWIGAGVLMGLLAIGLALVLPIWIEPMFNEFIPLREYAGLNEEARNRLEKKISDMLSAEDLPVQGVLVKDASRQGKHTNAYFTGFGPTRRIVLFDTLLKSHPEAEVMSVLAHEIGHFKHHHIYIGLTLGIAAAFAGLFLLHLILRWAVNRRPFYLKSPADPAGWPLVLLLMFLASWLVLPVQNVISRAFERQADWTSLELTGDPKVFIDAEKRFVQDNKMNLAPAPLSVWWFASHPPVVERIQMAKDWKKKQ